MRGKTRQNIRYLPIQVEGEIRNVAFQYVATYTTKTDANKIAKQLRELGKVRILQSQDGHDVYYRRPIYPAKNEGKKPLRRTVSITRLPPTQGRGFLIGKLRR